MKRLLLVISFLITAQILYAQDLPVSGTPGSEAIQSIIRSGITKNDNRAAAVMVFSEGKVVAAAYAGYRDDKNTLLVDEHTFFRIGSESKLFLAIAILQLCDRGIIKLDDPAIPLLKKCGIEPFRGKLADERMNAITVRMLLCHQGGFDRTISYDPISYEPAMAAAMGIKSVPIGNAAFCSYVLGIVRLQHGPGEYSSYSNCGYALLEPIVTHFGGCKTYVDYVNQKIFARAGVSPKDIRPTTTQLASAPLLEGAIKYNEAASLLNMETLLSIGGWEATSAGLMKFLATFFFGSYGQYPILPRALVLQMIEKPSRGLSSDASQGYLSMGFQVSPLSNGEKNIGLGGRITNQIEASVLYTNTQRILLVLLADKGKDISGKTFFSDFVVPLYAAIDRDWGPNYDFTSYYFSEGLVAATHSSK